MRRLARPPCWLQRTSNPLPLLQQLSEVLPLKTMRQRIQLKAMQNSDFHEVLRGLELCVRRCLVRFAHLKSKALSQARHGNNLIVASGKVQGFVAITIWNPNYRVAGIWLRTIRSVPELLKKEQSKADAGTRTSA